MQVNQINSFAYVKQIKFNFICFRCVLRLAISQKTSLFFSVSILNGMNLCTHSLYLMLISIYSHQVASSHRTFARLICSFLFVISFECRFLLLISSFVDQNPCSWKINSRKMKSAEKWMNLRTNGLSSGFAVRSHVFHFALILFIFIPFLRLWC